MWDSSKGWEKVDQICVYVTEEHLVIAPIQSTYVTEEHLVFVKWTLIYLTMDIVRWGGEGASGEGGGNGGNRGLSKARVRLE